MERVTRVRDAAAARATCHGTSQLALVTRLCEVTGLQSLNVVLPATHAPVFLTDGWLLLIPFAFHLLFFLPIFFTGDEFRDPGTPPLHSGL